MLQNVEKIVKDHDAYLWHKWKQAWNDRLKARTYEALRSAREEQRRAGERVKHDDDVQMLRCNACGHKQREGAWEEEMDRRARAMGSRGFINLSAPEECLKCGSTDLVEASKPRTRTSPTPKNVKRIADEFVTLGREHHLAVRRIDTATSDATYREARTLTEKARKEGILYDVLADLQRRRKTEDVKAALALLDAHFQKWT
jgi:hypothetical protein